MWNESRLELVKMFAVMIIVLTVITKGPLFLVQKTLAAGKSVFSGIFKMVQIYPLTNGSISPMSFPTQTPSPIIFPTTKLQPTPTTQQFPTPKSPSPTTKPTAVPTSPTKPPQPTDPPVALSGSFTDDFSGSIVKSNWTTTSSVSQNGRLVFSAPSRVRLQSHSISGGFTATADLVSAQSNSQNWMGVGIAFITYTNGDYEAYESGSGRRTGDVYLTYSGSTLTVYVNRLRDGNHEDWEKVGEASLSLGSRIQLQISRTSGTYSFSYNTGGGFSPLASVSDGPQGVGFVFLTANERDGNASVHAEFDNFILDL